ncbi:MAG: phosphoribosylglycinamide formyltransferase [Bacteroidota bacterium]|nr:phosphoribosylglycinamide formyltransferase [Bacteroidota bacterium]
MINIAIFASGSGTNAENIIKYFEKLKNIKISLILSNKKDAFVLKRAENFNIPSYVFNKNEFNKTNIVTNVLKSYNIDFIVLSGFLLLIPQNLILKYQNKIINIHPALLPKYGGKGMYGMNVHNAVIESNEQQSGISIHYVNNKYDEGNIIFQAKCKIDKNESPESLANKIHELEYKYFPKIIENVINKKFYL